MANVDSKVPQHTVYVYTSNKPFIVMHVVVISNEEYAQGYETQFEKKIFCRFMDT